MATSTIKTQSGTLYRENVAIASNLTIPANAVLAATQSVNATKSGYRPLGIVGTMSNNNQVNFLRYEITQGGIIYARVSNPTSSQITGVSITAIVLYERL